MKFPQQSPVAPLVNGVIYILIIIFLGTVGYLMNGWTMGDSFYMVIITLFTVGYDEVHPIATPALRALTITLIILGCTGMIYLTGAFVQFLTFEGPRDRVRVRPHRKIAGTGPHRRPCGIRGDRAG